MKRYLVIKGRAGLGNRMLAGVTGLLYAQLSGRTPVFDWRDSVYSHNGEDAFARLFHCPAAGALDDLPDTDSVAPIVWRGHLAKSLTDLEGAVGKHRRDEVLALRRRSCIDLTRLDHPEQIVVAWGWADRIEWLRHHLGPELARSSRKALLHGLLREHLRPCAEVAEQAAAFRREHLDAPSVGVHVRWSDSRSPLGAIEQRLDRLLHRHPGLTVFLATDSAAIEERFLLRGNVVTAPRWYPEPNMAMHNNPSSPDPLAHAREALLDMHLLAGCDHLIGGLSSTFFETAGLLADPPGPNLMNVAPPTALRIQNAVWRRVHQTHLSRPLLVYISRRGGP